MERVPGAITLYLPGSHRPPGYCHTCDHQHGPDTIHIHTRDIFSALEELDRIRQECIAERQAMEVAHMRQKQSEFLFGAR